MAPDKLMRVDIESRVKRDGCEDAILAEDRSR